MAETVAAAPVRWAPSFPEFAIKPKTDLLAAPTTDTDGDTYTRAPASSHLYGFKLLGDIEPKRFYTRTTGAGHVARAIIQVAFRPPAVNGSHPDEIASEYQYYFSTPRLTESYFQKLRSSAHPGEVIHKMIRDGVVYRRLY